MLKVLDLFSGIGGFSIGLERTGGFKTVAFCEIEPFPRAVLKKHWPDVWCFEDVKELSVERLRFHGLEDIDVICGGFPCQDISLAGKGAGLEGERSGLWSEYARLIQEVRPRYAIVENVAALRSRGLDQVLGSLAAIGYDAEWHCIPASAVGAPHRRDRVWIIAYPQRVELRQQSGWCSGESGASEAFATEPGKERLAAHPDHAGSLTPGRSHCERATPVLVGSDSLAGPGRSSWWLVEPNVGRVANGVPARVDRLRALGNAVVPQIPEIIGRAILEVEGLLA